MKVFIAFIILCLLLIWDLINGNNKEFSKDTVDNLPYRPSSYKTNQRIHL